jgi:hypothetical protein
MLCGSRKRTAAHVVRLPQVLEPDNDIEEKPAAGLDLLGRFGVMSLDQDG